MEDKDVTHPQHYCGGSIECIDAMEAAYGIDVVKAFCLGNAFKYQWRCTSKGKLEQDLAKAEWYREKYLELCRRQQEQPNKEVL